MIDVSKLFDLMSIKDIKSLRDLSRESKIPYTTLNYMLDGHDLRVGTAVELAKYLKESLDSLVRTNFTFSYYKVDEYGLIEHETVEADNIYDATVKYMM